MNKQSKIVVISAFVFTAGSAVFLLTRTSIGQDRSGVGGPYVNEVGSAELDAIEAFIEPQSPEEAVAVANQLADRAFSTPDLLLPNEGRSLPNEQQLRKLLTDRILLMFNPDYAVFVSHIGDLCDCDGHEALKGTMFEDEDLWYAFANTYRYAGVAIDATRATLDLGSVTMGEGLWGGRQTTFGDPGVYGSDSVMQSGASVFSVGIPVMIPPTNEPDAKIMVLYATLSFVWDQARNKWIPHRTSVYDPTGTLGSLPALWM